MSERKFYRICDLSPMLDGLVVEGEELEGKTPSHLVSVSRFIDPATNIGDHLVSLPVEQGGLFIDELNLEEIDDPTTREFASDSPFGELLDDLQTSRGGLGVSLQRFEKVISVSVRSVTSHPVKTIYSQNFVGDLEKKWQELLEQVCRGDIDELVFFLKDLKEKELHGEA